MTSLALTIFSRTNCSTWNFQLSQSLDSFSVYQPQITLHPCFSGSKQPISWFSFPSSLDSKAPNINPSLPAPSFYWTPPLSPSLQPNPETCFLCSCTWTAKMGWGRGERRRNDKLGVALRIISAVPNQFSSHPHKDCSKQPIHLLSLPPSSIPLKGSCLLFHSEN